MTANSGPQKSLHLAIGEEVSLSDFNRLHVGFGWEVNNSSSNSPFDFDGACFLLGEKNKVLSSKDFVFYSNSDSSCQSVHIHGFESRSWPEDDERMSVNLFAVPPNVKTLLFCSQIFEAAQRKQNFGLIDTSYIRLVDESTGVEICSTFSSPIK